MGIVKSHYRFADKIIFYVEGDVMAVRVRDAVQDVLYTQYKKGFSAVVIINEQNRAVTLMR